MEQLAVQQVLGTIRAALSVQNAEREPAEALLRSWEADAAPGFLLALVRIVEEPLDEVMLQQGVYAWIPPRRERCRLAALHRMICMRLAALGIHADWLHCSLLLSALPSPRACWQL